MKENCLGLIQYILFESETTLIATNNDLKNTFAKCSQQNGSPSTPILLCCVINYHLIGWKIVFD